MKDFDVKSEEWWEVTKELEKNLAQHKVDERNFRYKLEIYKVCCGSPTNIKISGQVKEIEARPSGTT